MRPQLESLLGSDLNQLKRTLDQCINNPKKINQSILIEFLKRLYKNAIDYKHFERTKKSLKKSIKNSLKILNLSDRDCKKRIEELKYFKFEKKTINVFMALPQNFEKNKHPKKGRAK